MINDRRYVLVDTEKKLIIDKIQELPEYWKNISGLPGLSDEELEDLSWAGHFNLGWININSAKIDEYELTQRTLDEFKIALENGKKIKNQTIHEPSIPSSFKRELKSYQKLSVEHMIQVGNSANFSVPGSGKTTIAYAAISHWIQNKTVEKIFVIGPTASFLPWEEEYQECFGHKPRSCRISGNLAQEIHNLGDSFDLFLVHFQTVISRTWEISTFMEIGRAHV